MIIKSSAEIPLTSSEKRKRRVKGEPFGLLVVTLVTSFAGSGTESVGKTTSVAGEVMPNESLIAFGTNFAVTLPAEPHSTRTVMVVGPDPLSVKGEKMQLLAVPL